MKKIVVVCGLALLALASVSCSKERTCRCSALHRQTIRIYTIKGSCEKLQYVLYDEDPAVKTDITDSLLCTDHLFD